MTEDGDSLMVAVRRLRAAQALTREAQIMIHRDASLSPADREQMSFFAEQNWTHLGLTAAYGEHRLLRGDQE